MRPATRLRTPADLDAWDGQAPLAMVPTRALLARRDRLFGRLGLARVTLVLAAPDVAEPATLPELFAWTLDALRWQRLGLLGATVALSSELPACLGAPLGLPRHVHGGSRGPGAPLACTACAAADQGCEGVPAGVLAAYTARDGLRRDLAALVKTPPLDTLDGAWIQHDLGLRSAVRAMDDGAGPIGAPPGLPTRTVDMPLVDRADGRLVLDAAAHRRITYAGSDEALLAELAELEGRLLAGTAPMEAVHARLGQAFGYPACCVEAFVADNRAYETCGADDRGVNPVHLARIAARSAAFDPLLNPFVRAPRALRLIEHLPCRFDCPASRGLARAVARELLRRAPALAPVLPGLLATVALVLPDRDELLFVGAVLSATRARIERVVQPGGLTAHRPFEADAVTLGDDGKVVLWAGEHRLREIEIENSTLTRGLPRFVAFGGAGRGPGDQLTGPSAS